jgi:ABC-type Fe3+/spermidine/putrescine transport system ATPase subunit
LLPPATDADVRCVDLTKRFGDVVAVDDLDLGIERGEFFTLLEPLRLR